MVEFDLRNETKYEDDDDDNNNNDHDDDHDDDDNNGNNSSDDMNTISSNSNIFSTGITTVDEFRQQIMTLLRRHSTQQYSRSNSHQDHIGDRMRLMIMNSIQPPSNTSTIFMDCITLLANEYQGLCLVLLLLSNVVGVLSIYISFHNSPCFCLISCNLLYIYRVGE